MIRSEISSVRSRLLQQREGLLQAFNDVVTHDMESQMWDDDPAEAAVGVMGQRLQQLMDRLVEIDAAIERIDGGEFGTCAEGITDSDRDEASREEMK